MTNFRDHKKQTTCPACASHEVVPISYGLPTQEAIEAAKRREVVLGGCMIPQEFPTRKCLACGEAFLFRSLADEY